MKKAASQDAAGAEETSSGTGAQARVASLKLNTSNLSSSYCNVVSANGTREEVVLSFGVNQDWDRKGAALDVQMLHRIVLSPLGAKRLHDRLNAVLQEYERRAGVLD